MGFLLFTSYFFTLTSNGRIFWEVIGKREEVISKVAFRFGESIFIVFATLYTAKQGVWRAEQAQAKADDYATGASCRLYKAL